MGRSLCAVCSRSCWHLADLASKRPAMPRCHFQSWSRPPSVLTDESKRSPRLSSCPRTSCLADPSKSFSFQQNRRLTRGGSSHGVSLVSPTPSFGSKEHLEQSACWLFEKRGQSDMDCTDRSPGHRLRAHSRSHSLEPAPSGRRCPRPWIRQRCAGYRQPLSRMSRYLAVVSEARPSSASAFV